MHTREEQLAAFGRLLEVMDTLRVKCPWDRKQTNESLRPNTIEETYELCDALIKDDRANICKELGDVLLHVVFYAKIGSETGDFDIADVCNHLCDKLIFRHPHVYGNVVAENAAQVCENWEQLKMKEKDGNKTVLGGVPKDLPALIKAYRIQDKARNVGFDWEQRTDVWDKVQEELGELQTELETLARLRDKAEAENDDVQKNAAKQRAEQEFGDFLFSIINAGRLYHINPDNALERTNQKFIRRFGYVEQQAHLSGRHLTDMTLGEMDKLWNEAKRQERLNTNNGE
jgi:MazG family protein